MKKVNNSVEVVNSFAETTTIHGVYQIILQKQYLWILLFLSMLGLTIYSSTHNILEYLTFDVETALTTEQFAETPFPSITFCERSPLIESSVFNDAFYTLSAMYYSRTNKEMIQIFTMLKDKCTAESTNVTTKDSATLPDVVKDFLENFNRFNQEHVLDSFKSVMKCWWMNQEVKCDGLFFNRLLDGGPCFTFNPSTDWLKNGMKSVGYGFNLSSADKVTNTFGPKAGVRLVLYTGGKDHCGLRYWQGAGFQVKIHDPNDATPMFSLGKTILLDPGYESNIQISPIVNDRKTASLGKCLGAGYFRSTAGSDYYNQPICFLACFLEKIIQACKCKPWFVSGVEDQFASSVGYSLKYLNDCVTMNDLSCVKAQSLKSIMSDVPQEISCSQCLPACQEITYDYMVTRKRFPANKHFAKVLLQSMNSSTSVEDFRKHFLSVNFFIDVLRLQEVKQFQSKTIIDVFIYFGGVIGLFMGMSFLSIFEIFQIMADLIDILLLKFCCQSSTNHRVKVNKIQPIKVTSENTVTVGTVNRRRR